MAHSVFPSRSAALPAQSRTESAAKDQSKSAFPTAVSVVECIPRNSLEVPRAQGQAPAICPFLKRNNEALPSTAPPSRWMLPVKYGEFSWGEMNDHGDAPSALAASDQQYCLCCQLRFLRRVFVFSAFSAFPVNCRCSGRAIDRARSATRNTGIVIGGRFMLADRL